MTNKAMVIANIAGHIAAAMMVHARPTPPRSPTGLLSDVPSIVELAGHIVEEANQRF